MEKTTLRRIIKAAQLVTYIFCTFYIVSCDLIDDYSSGNHHEELAVQEIVVIDTSNYGNSQDIKIQFDAPSYQSNLKRFRVYVSKTTSLDMFDEQFALSLGDDKFLEIEHNKATYAIRFPETLLDTDGDVIVEDVAYQISILSIYMNSKHRRKVVLSDFTDVFQLTTPPAGVFTLPVTYPPNSGLDGITIDSEKNIYVSNFGVFVDGAGSGSEVFKIDVNRDVDNYATELDVPGGLVTDENDVVYVNNGGNIHKLINETTKLLYANFDLGFAGLVMDENRNIYSGGYQHSLILKITPDMDVIELTSDARLAGTVGIAYHKESASLFAANFNTGEIYKITMDGSVSELVNLGDSIGYITEMNGELYATSFFKNKILKITLEGAVETIAGTGDKSQKDGPLLEASFDWPNGIIGDAENKVLYVSDWGSPRVSKIQL
ncbi:NHL repeat-containing protein [Aquimarina pacifica]|uniref:hypothetical protein n=1 Tax=Aquimarina pacifica TaxID=1296415 RepID=UPI00046F3F47|nr:hypothetical protein [Aquimarina pacifica]